METTRIYDTLPASSGFDRKVSEMKTPEQVAEEFQVSGRTVYGWLRRGELTAVKIGALWRIEEADIRAFVDRQVAEKLMARVTGEHPDTVWKRGRCVQCARAIPVPENGGDAGWCCSQVCWDNWHFLLYQFIDPGSEEYGRTAIPEVVPYWL